VNVTQLIKRVRRSAFVEDTAVDWTDVNIVEELNDTMTQLYSRAVVNGDQGHWQLTEYTPLVAGQRSYRMPARSVMGTVIRSQITTTNDVDWYPLEEMGESDAARYEYDTYDSQYRKIIRGENIYLLPPVQSSGYVMRTHYAIRPSRMCMPQATPTTAGVITVINPTTRALTVAVSLQSIAEDGTNGGNILTGTRQIDIIRVGGWHKVQWTGNATFSGSGTTITLAVDASGLDEANDLSDIAIGDVVRVADQTDWPALPADYHRSLADATATKILTARGMHEASAALAQTHVSPDLQRFGDLVRLRDESSAYVFVAPEFC
jgi:hypothetical protein